MILSVFIFKMKGVIIILTKKNINENILGLQPKNIRSILIQILLQLGS